MHEPDAPAWAREWIRGIRKEQPMTMQDLIEITESEIAVRWVELNDWIPAKCLIDERISDLKAKIEEKEDYLRYLKSCKVVGEK